MLKWIKNMKLWKKIVLGILLLFIIACAVIAVWQRNNIQAIIQTVSYSEEEIASKLNETKKNFEDEAKNQYSLIVRDFTAEEERQIMTGELTVEEAMARLTEEYTAAVESYRQENASSVNNTEASDNTNDDTADSSKQGKNQSSTKKDDKKTASSQSDSKNTSGKTGNSKSETSKAGSKNTSNKNSNAGKSANTNKSSSGNSTSGNSSSGKNNSSGAVSSDVNEIVGDQVVELYSVKAYYLGQLGQLEASARQDYAALPPEQRNSSGLKSLASKYIGQANALLGQCDAQVSSIVGDLKNDLQAQGADTSIIQTILSTYENEKALKKAYYMKLLGN